MTSLTDRLVRQIEHHHKILFLIVSALWLLVINSLMIADVWDETNALLILESEPVAGSGALNTVFGVWLQQLPLDVYRPVGSSLILLLGKLTGGNFVFLRFVNAVFILGAAGFFALSLLRLGTGIPRAMAFFVVMLFSASAVMTSSWFANVFDATCLFFIALACWSYVTRNTWLCCIALALSVFSKEIYVLALPFLGLLALQDNRRNNRTLLASSLVIIGFSLIYWTARQAVAPLGSAADVHTFESAGLALSLSSFLAGLVFQFSKFTLFSPVFWIGLAALLLTMIGIRNNHARLAAAMILLMSGGIYWGMFDFQGNNIVTSHNFVGRLYLVPYVLLLFIVCRDASKPVLALMTITSVWGLVATYRDYAAFQATYREIYALAESADDTLFVYFPEKPLDDFRRDLQIGDFPLAAYRIDVNSGGLEQLPAE